MGEKKRKIRVWRLGSIDPPFLPSARGLKCFEEALASAMEREGDADIVWGPDVDVQIIDVEDDDVDVLLRDPRVTVVQRGDGVERLTIKGPGGPATVQSPYSLGTFSWRR